MQFVYFFAAFLLVNRLKTVLHDPVLLVKWKSNINYASIGVWVLFAMASGAFHSIDSEYADGLSDIAGCLVLLGIMYYINKQPDFSSYRFYIEAHYPLVAVGVISAFAQMIAPEFYEKYQVFFICGIIGAFIWTISRWTNSKKQREELKMATLRNNQLDTLVAKRTAELTQQKNELENTVKLLQATQQQLIQQEKLASLGELTAGIAHEIQNPLNFVNNFSEVSMELVDEMEEEFNKGDKEEAMSIAADIKQNLEKIIHHGKRADAIVKNMLQHSRTNSGEKQLTDINALADEYFRLSYHGLRAKDKMFNANMVTSFDAALPKVNVIPQDIGRVLLNLFNNAFYAVQQRHNKGDADYKPEVKVSTAIKGKFIEIRVTDNGIGIPDEVKDKILQPFFTTKPTGEGTGLGLSLSYDILVKGHGGSMTIESVENEYATFIINLPV
ncbi:MAG: sensor histidine kinase [Mucilaginibacter sp.]